MRCGLRVLSPVSATLLLLQSACGYYPSVDVRLERAAAQIAGGQYAAAESELAAVLKREPTHAKALLSLVDVELKLGRADAAHSYLTRAQNAHADAAKLESLSSEVLLGEGKFDELLKQLDARAKPVDARILALRAAAHTGLRDFTAADADLQSAARLDPDDAEVLLRLAQLRLAQGRTADAAAALDRAVSAKSWLANVWILRGGIEMSQGHTDAARDAFQRVADAKPGQATLPQQMQSLAGLAEIYLAKNAVVNATEVVNRLRAVAPGSILLHYLQGRLALQSGDAPKAVAELSAVTRAMPNDSSAATLLGAALFAQGSREQAQATLSEVVAKNPDNNYARKLLAQTQLANNQADAARQTLAAVGQSAQVDAQFNFLMASALMKLGDVSAAIPYLEKSAAAQDNIGVQQGLARAYLTTGEFAKARAALEKIPAAKRDKSVQSLFVMSRVAGQSGLEAMRTLEQVVADDAAEPEVVAVAGAFALRLGNVVAARRYFAKALEKNPKNITALLGAAQVASVSTDRKAANDYLMAVLKADPTNQLAFLALANLEQGQGNTSASRSWLEKAISADPSTTLARLVLAQLEFKSGDTPKARSLLDQAIAVAADKSVVANAAGEAAFAAGQAEEALLRFNKAVEIGSVPASINLARTQIALKRFADARRTLEGIKDRSYAILASVMLVSLDVGTGDIDKARQRITVMRKDGLNTSEANELDGDVSVAARQLDAASRSYGSAYDAAPSHARAIKLFQVRQALKAKEPQTVLSHWLEKNADDLQARMLLAQYLQQAGREREAITQYETLQRAAPANPVLLNNLAWSYYRVGDKRALETARQAYQVNNNSVPDIADTYGWLLVQAGDLAAGRPILERAAAKMPKNPSVRFHLAVAKAKAGETSSARDELRALVAGAEPFDEKAAAVKFLETLSSGISRRN